MNIKNIPFVFVEKDKLYYTKDYEKTSDGCIHYREDMCTSQEMLPDEILIALKECAETKCDADDVLIDIHWHLVNEIFYRGLDA